MKNTVVVIQTILLLIGLSVVAAGAQTDAAGSGAFTARGNGLVMFSGSGSVEFECKGFIMLHAEADIEMQDGEVIRIELHNDAAIYIEVDGHVTVTGENIKATCGGANITMRTRSDGMARLTGAGFYRLGLMTGFWTADGIGIEIINTAEE